MLRRGDSLGGNQEMEIESTKMNRRQKNERNNPSKDKNIYGVLWMRAKSEREDWQDNLGPD